MEIKITKSNGKSIAIVTASNIIIGCIQDAVDIIGNCYYQGADGIILHQHSIDKRFFDLKTRLAGEVLQKFSTYKMRLAIVGDFTEYTSSSLNDFIFESNKVGQINFVNTIEEAKEKLEK